jgi:hypothetical protein
MYMSALSHVLLLMAIVDVAAWEGNQMLNFELKQA